MNFLLEFTALQWLVFFLACSVGGIVGGLLAYVIEYALWGGGEP